MTDGFPTMDRDVSSYLRDADGDGNDPGNCASIGAPYPESNNCSDHMDDVAYYMRHNDLRRSDTRIGKTRTSSPTRSASASTRASWPIPPSTGTASICRPTTPSSCT